MIKIYGLLFVFLAVPFTAAAQTPTPVTVKGDGNYSAPTEGRLKSNLMEREMPYRVILPVGYSSEKNARFPVVYLLHGLTGHYDNWTDRTRIGIYAQTYKVIIVTPEGENGWYTDSVGKANDKYESYIVKELMPEIDRKFRTLPVREKRAIAGLSMGGYGALKFGVKYPENFVLAGSFSGALRAASLTEKQVPGAIGKTIDEIFGAADSDARRSNDLFGLIRNMTPERANTLPFLYIDCGTEDFLFQNNRLFIDLLIEKKIRHEYRQLPGAHDWKYWGNQVQEFLEVADSAFAAKQN